MKAVTLPVFVLLALVSPRLSSAEILDFAWTARITYIDNTSGADLVLEVDDIVSWTTTMNDSNAHIVARGSWTGQLLTATSDTEVFSVASTFTAPLSDEPVDRTLVSTNGSGTMQFSWPTGGGARIDSTYTNQDNSTSLDAHLSYADDGFNSVEYYKSGDWVIFMDVQDVTITVAEPEPQIELTSIATSNGVLVLQWEANRSNLLYAVESCTNLPTAGWSPVMPTSQWWIAETVWTNTGPGHNRIFFRIKAKEQ